MLLASRVDYGLDLVRNETWWRLVIVIFTFNCVTIGSIKHFIATLPKLVAIRLLILLRWVRIYSFDLVSRRCLMHVRRGACWN